MSIRARAIIATLAVAALVGSAAGFFVADNTGQTTPTTPTTASQRHLGDMMIPVTTTTTP